MLRGRGTFLLKAASGPEVLRAQQLLQRTEAFLEQLLIVSFDSVAAREFDRLRQVYRKVGHADLMIASLTLSSKATLVTRNLRHFQQIAGLSVINSVLSIGWIEPLPKLLTHCVKAANFDSSKS